MSNRKNIFIIIPSYNEAIILPSLIKELISMGYSIVLVDDGSSDQTPKLGLQYPIYYLRHIFNLGQGAALQTGMSFALSEGAEYLAHFDADGQHQPQDISSLLEPLIQDKADIALGSRFLREEDKARVPWLVRNMLKVATKINGILTGVWISDAHNGLRALTRKAASLIHLRENGYAHASEILVQIRKRNLRYVEVPTQIIYTPYSMGKGQKPWNAFNILFDILVQKFFR